MKTVVMNWRYWAIALIWFAAFVCLAGMPDDNDPRYFAIVVLSKTAAALLAFVGYKLYMWFAETGKINRIDDFLDE